MPAKHYFDTATEASLRAQMEDFLALPGSLEIKYIRAAMTTAQNDYINTLLGKPLKDKLLSDVVPDPGSSTQIYRDTLEAIREPLSHLTMIKAAPMLNLKPGAGGFTTANNEQESTVQWWQMRDFKRALQLNATNALDRLLLFLESEGKNIPEYDDSDAQKENNRNFVNTFKQANLYLPIVRSVYVLRNMRPAMSRVDERVLNPILTSDLYGHLTNLSAQGEEWGVYEPLRSLVYAVELHFAFAESMDEGTISWTEEYGIYVPIIAEAEIAGRIQQETIRQREELSRKHYRFAQDAVNDLKEHLSEKAEDYPLFDPEEQQDRPYIQQSLEDKKTQMIYKGIGLP